MKTSTVVAITLVAISLPTLIWPMMQAADARSRRVADQTCESDLVCLAERHKFPAMISCQAELQRRLPTVDFTHGFARPFFTWQGIGSLSDWTVAYTGRAARFRDIGGKWQNLFYRCSYDVATEKVGNLDVRTEGLDF